MSFSPCVLSITELSGWAVSKHLWEPLSHAVMQLGMDCSRACHLDTGFEYQGAASQCRWSAPKANKRAPRGILLLYTEPVSIFLLSLSLLLASFWSWQ